MNEGFDPFLLVGDVSWIGDVILGIEAVSICPTYVRIFMLEGSREGVDRRRDVRGMVKVKSGAERFIRQHVGVKTCPEQNRT